MSLDKSLVAKGALARHRNVLTRWERIEKLLEEGRWSFEESVFGLPKVRNIKMKRKVKAEKEEAPAEAVEGVEPAAAEGAEEAAAETPVEEPADEKTEKKQSKE